MARKKVRLQYIENDTARRVTYKKRVKGIVKKTQELSVLCGVDACAIMYSPYEKSPVVWPSCEDEAKRILMEFKRKPEMDQSQRRFTQRTFLEQSVAKTEERLVKMQRRNRELEMENLMGDLLNGKPIEQTLLKDVEDLLWFIEDKIRSVQHRMQMLQGTTYNTKISDISINTNTNASVHVPPPGYNLPNVGNDMMMMMGGVSDNGVWKMEVMDGNGWHFGGQNQMQGHQLH